VQHWEREIGGRWSPRQNLVAGLVPRATGIDVEDLAKAIREREEGITRRARNLAEQAVRAGAPWANPFGAPPTGRAVASAWWDSLAVIAAYRDRWHVNSSGILGDEAALISLQQAAHRARARGAGQEAARLVGLVPQHIAPAPGAPSPEIGPEVDV
jgi:hypothetical protein